MSEFKFVKENGRSIPREDIIFGINTRANKMIAERGRENVVNGTVGALLDDDGQLAILSLVVDIFKHLAPRDFAEYAPIGGLPEFKEAVKKAAFGSYVPGGFTRVVAAPGGTGTLRNAVSNFTSPGDKILTSDWHWTPYNTIAEEQGRTVDKYQLFNDQRQFNVASFKEHVEILAAAQGSLLIIINTPAHNPTGYSLTLEDWDNVIKVLTDTSESGATIVLLVDVAYIDFAGDEEECRKFIPKLEELPENVLPVISYSASKTFTSYGMRCGAMICMAKTEEVAQEFLLACQYSSRATWSNSPRAPQVMIAKVYRDAELLAKVDRERAAYRERLLARGRAFESAADAAGLEIVPFDAGFFVSIPCSDPISVSSKLEEEGIFIVPLEKGLRVSIASISEKHCRRIPAKIKVVIDRMEKKD